MNDPNYILLYVDDPTSSATFYAGLLGRPPAHLSPAFALFPLSSGVKLGLWARHDVQPATTAGAGGAELDFTMASDAEVDATHADWLGRGIRVVQPPVRLDFGYAFTALDPDGHRLRVFAPAAA